MKKQSNLSRLLQIAGNHKYLTRASWVLSAVSALIALVPESTHTYLAVLNELGRPSPKIDPKLEHILITGMFHTFFELVIHEMPLRDAENYIREMRAFYTAGWMKIMGQ